MVSLGVYRSMARFIADYCWTVFSHVAYLWCARCSVLCCFCWFVYGRVALFTQVFPVMKALVACLCFGV